VLRTGGNYNQIVARRLPYSNRRGGRWTTGPGPERKYIDASYTGLPLQGIAIAAASGGDSGTPSAPLLLNGLAQGTDSTTRIGRKISMKSIQGHYVFTSQLQASGLLPAGVLGGWVRLLIVYDMQTNGATPTVADILQNATSNALTSPLNLNNRERFKVLVNKYRCIDPSNSQSAMIRFYKRLNHDVIFNAGNAGTVADIQTGGIFFVLATTLTATAAPLTDGNAYVRIRFLDD